MAKCAVCEKSLAHGNKISIARSHVSRRNCKRRNKTNICLCKMFTFWKSNKSLNKIVKVGIIPTFFAIFM